MQILIAALLIITPNWKQFKRSSVEWINTLWSNHAVEYYSAIKGTELLIQVTTQMPALSEGNQIFKITYYMNPFT